MGPIWNIRSRLVTRFYALKFVCLSKRMRLVLFGEELGIKLIVPYDYVLEFRTN